MLAGFDDRPALPDQRVPSRADERPRNSVFKRRLRIRVVSRPASDPPRAGDPGTLTTSFATAYARVSNDTPSVNAFCCVAPGVRFSDFAILATGIFWRARVFSSRTSSLVHSRRFAFFAIFTGSDVLGAAY